MRCKGRCHARQISNMFLGDLHNKHVSHAPLGLLVGLTSNAEVCSHCQGALTTRHYSLESKQEENLEW